MEVRCLLTLEGMATAKKNGICVFLTIGEDDKPRFVGCSELSVTSFAVAGVPEPDRTEAGQGEAFEESGNEAETEQFCGGCFGAFPTYADGLQLGFFCGYCAQFPHASRSANDSLVEQLAYWGVPRELQQKKIDQFADTQWGYIQIRPFGVLKSTFHLTLVEEAPEDYRACAGLVPLAKHCNLLSQQNPRIVANLLMLLSGEAKVDFATWLLQQFARHLNACSCEKYHHAHAMYSFANQQICMDAVTNVGLVPVVLEWNKLLLSTDRFNCLSDAMHGFDMVILMNVTHIFEETCVGGAEMVQLLIARLGEKHPNDSCCCRLECRLYQPLMIQYKKTRNTALLSHLTGTLEALDVWAVAHHEFGNFVIQAFIHELLDVKECSAVYKIVDHFAGDVGKWAESTWARHCAHEIIKTLPKTTSQWKAICDVWEHHIEDQHLRKAMLHRRSRSS